MRLNNRKQAIANAALISGLLFTGMSFSAQKDIEAISMRCGLVHYNLNKMVEEHSTAPCAYNVIYSGWMMQRAAVLVYSEQYQDALKDLTIAEENLSKVYSKTEECAYFSPKVRPFIDEVSLLSHELEAVLTNKTHH